MSIHSERRALRDDLIDDIVEPPSSAPAAKPSFFPDNAKIARNRTYSSLPFLFHKPKCHRPEKPPLTFDNTRLPSKTSPLLASNDERRKEIDRIIQHLYNGKLLSATSDEFSGSEHSEPLVRAPKREAAPTVTVVTPAVNDEDEKKSNQASTHEPDVTSLQRELQEKELDISHLHKEIQDLQLENKLLKAKGEAGVYTNGYTNNNNDADGSRREKPIFRNDLLPGLLVNRASRIDEIHQQQKEIFEGKLKSFEKQMRVLASENDKLKQNSHQSERVIIQLKRENEELQQKVIEVKKRNDELFYQEFHSLRNNMKALKERNNLLFQENLRLQQEQQGVTWRPTAHDQQQQPPMPPSGAGKISNAEAKHRRGTRDESPYMSEGSDSTNYLISVSADRYKTRPSLSVYRSSTIDGGNQARPTRYNAAIGHNDASLNINTISAMKSHDAQVNFRPSKSHRTMEWNDSNTHSNEDLANGHPTMEHSKPSSHPFSSTHSLQGAGHQDGGSCSNLTDFSQFRKSVLIANPKRPYAPLSINDIHLGDTIKFSRAGGKVSKGTVKYIGALPGKNDQYLGLELDDEESKHDGVYQDQRIFQCKANKGVFVGFNKVIMAWSGQ